MKLDPNQCFDVNILKGALLTNPSVTEFYITGVGVDIANHEILIDLDDASAVEWSTLKDWSIQFQLKPN